MTTEIDESVFDQFNQRHYDDEEDDDLELLDPPLLVKLRREGKIRRSKSSLTLGNTPSPRIKPLFRFSKSRAKVKPINEVSIHDTSRQQHHQRPPSPSPSSSSTPNTNTNTQKVDDNDNNNNNSNVIENDLYFYGDFYQSDPFGYMNDTFTFVTQKSAPSPQVPSAATSPSPTVPPSASPTLVNMAPSSSSTLVSPFFGHAPDYHPVTPRVTYSLVGGFPSPAFFAAAPAGGMGPLLQEEEDGDGEGESSVFRSRSRSGSDENAYAPTPRYQGLNGVMPPVREGDEEKGGEREREREREKSGGGGGDGNGFSIRSALYSSYK